MSAKGAVLSLIVLCVGGLLLFSRTRGGVLVGLSLLVIAAGAIVTAVSTRQSNRSNETSIGKREA